LPPTAPAGCFDLAVTCGVKLGHKARFLMLAEAAYYSADHCAARIIAGRQIIAARCEHGDSSLAQLENTLLPHHKLMSEAAGVFHEHCAHAVAKDAFHHCVPAGPRAEYVSAADSLIIKPVVIRDPDARRLGKLLDFEALPLVAVFVGTAVACTRFAQLAARLHFGRFARRSIALCISDGVDVRAIMFLFLKQRKYNSIKNNTGYYWVLTQFIVLAMLFPLMQKRARRCRSRNVGTRAGGL
jgi:hypothetical protein